MWRDLQAIATGRRLGAVMSAFDVRPAVKEQVQSLGATFIEDEELQRAQAETAGGYAREQTAEERDRSQALVRRHVGASDFVITTALVPGRPCAAPHHAGDGRGHAAGLGHHRSRGGDGRQLRTHIARVRSSFTRASSSTGLSTCHRWFPSTQA